MRYRVSFRLTDGKNREHIPASEIVLKRDFSFNDDQALSKESEEALLYRDMRRRRRAASWCGACRRQSCSPEGSENNRQGAKKAKIK